MKTSSAKSKGRVACKQVKELLLKYAQGILVEDDLTVTPSGVTGVDITMSPLARSIYNLAIECKNQESLAIWKALEQAASHADKTDRTPVLFFRRNRSKLYVALEAEDFIKMIRGTNGKDTDSKSIK